MTAAILLLVALILTPCIGDGGRLVWVRSECPPGTIAAVDALPDACESGFCETCPPGGCGPLESTVMCCCGSGPGACFEIIATTMECGTDPSCDVLYCDHGYCDETGEAHCIIDA